MPIHMRRRCSIALLALLTLTTALAGCASGQTGSTPAATHAGGSSGQVASLSTSTPTQPSTAATPRATSTAKPTTTSSATSGLGAYSFPLLPPRSPLPSEAFCAAHIQRSTWEPRPQNQAANASVPTSAQIASLSPWDDSIGVDPQADQLRKQITGNFTGTTDEILQWVACKWGVPVDVVRAEAVVESYWSQHQVGDWSTTQSECPPGTWTGSGCYRSYGILQIMYQYFASSWPMSRDDTAFNAEYVYGIIRTCYEGWTTYLSERTPLPGYSAYHAGDLWGCLGRWYSGSWYDQGAVDYIAQVKAAYEQKPWRSSGF